MRGTGWNKSLTTQPYISSVSFSIYEKNLSCTLLVFLPDLSFAVFWFHISFRSTECVSSASLMSGRSIWALYIYIECVLMAIECKLGAIGFRFYRWKELVCIQM